MARRSEACSGIVSEHAQLHDEPPRPASAATTTTTVERIRENQLLIQKVLHYWFGQHNSSGGGLEECRKDLWMIADQRVEHRRRVDADICRQFYSLLVELATTPQNDNAEEEEEEKNNKNNSSSRWQEWCCDDVLYGYPGKVAAILVLDQFGRHVHRHLEEAARGLVDNAVPDTGTLSPQSAIDARALIAARRLVAVHATELRAGLVPAPLRVFGLMPYRHAQTVAAVEYVLDEIRNLEEQVGEAAAALVRRFRNATTRRLAVLQDEARRTGNGSSSTGAGEGITTATKNIPTNTSSSSSSSLSFPDEDILEAAPFAADMTTAPQHEVHETMRQFLAQQCGLHPTSDASSSNDNDGARCWPVVVSLSGGVDSMVIASVLAHLARSQAYPLHVVAVHIDYANRPESAAEASYVDRWCREHGIVFYCRRIDEVKRGVTARDAYEKMSRTVRYDFYKHVLGLQAVEQQLPTGAAEAGVMLGHHCGDVRENVLSNAHKGCGPLDLSGMTRVSRNHGVTMYRPLLPLEKEAIFDYAHTYGVPYFKDTTPHWSTRGKLRNHLLPLLQEVYGEGCMQHLSHLAAESDACRDLVQATCLRPFYDHVVSNQPAGISFATQPWKEESFYFWKMALRETLHGVGLGMFTDKSLISFLKRIQVPTVREGWLQCRKDYAVYLQHDGVVLVLYPRAFPWRRSDFFSAKEDQVVVIGAETAMQIGPWIASAQCIEVADKDEKEERLDQKALPFMHDLLKGVITYTMEVPTWWNDDEKVFEPRPLVFDKYIKATRPRAWKGLDTKVQETLPLLGNDATANEALKEPIDCCAFRLGDDGKQIRNPTQLVEITLELTWRREGAALVEN